MHSRLLTKIDDRQVRFIAPRSTKESLLATMVWAFSLLIIALPDGISSRIGKIGLNNSASSLRIRKAWGSGDAGSLLDVAMTWAHGHQLDASTQFWIVHLWSPGMSILEIPLVWLEKLGLPIFWSLLATTLLLWGTIFYLIWKYGSVLIGRITLSVASLLLLFSWDFGYIFRDALFYTEGLGYGLLLLGLLIASWIVLNPENHREKRLAIIAGISIGVSVWIRHVSDTGLVLFIALGSLLIIWNMKFSKQARNSRQSLNSSKGNAKSAARRKEQLATRWRALGALPYLTLSGLIGLFVTLPWRIMNPLIFRGAPGLMSSTGNILWHNVWYQNSSSMGKYWGSYGMNWACDIDAETCSKVNPDLFSSGNNIRLMIDTAKAVLLHPIAYLQNRATYAYRNWIPGGMHPSFNSQIIVAALSGFTLFLAFYMYFRIQDKRKRLLALIWLPFLTMQSAQLTIIHYEPRYFIPVRFLMLGFALTLIALHPKKVRN